MESYLWLKLIHVVSATILFGTGLGTAFFMYSAVNSGDLAAIRTTSRHVVLADWLFTTPTAVIQPLTGILLMQRLGFPFDSRWFYAVVALYLLVAACWIPVVFIQVRMKRLAIAAKGALPASFHRLFRIWFWLGVPAFGSMLVLFYLMFFKSGLYPPPA